MLWNARRPNPCLRGRRQTSLMTLTPEVAFEQHRERLVSVIYLGMGPDLRKRMDPEDVLQEVAIEAINSWRTLSDPANAGAWLVTLARRKVARILRDQVGVAARDPRREHAMKTDLPVADRRSGPVTAADRKDRLAPPRPAPAPPPPRRHRGAAPTHNQGPPPR